MRNRVDEGQRNELWNSGESAPPEQASQRKPTAEKTEYGESRNERGGEDRVPLAPIGVRGVQRVLKMILKWRGRSRREVPEQPDQQGRVNRPMLRQPPQIRQRIWRDAALVANMGEHALRLPGGVSGNRSHDRRTHQKQDAASPVGVGVLEKLAQSAADEQRRDRGNGDEDIPTRADLPGHRMLLAYS